MSHYTLGIDTSNYATSLAVFHTAGEVVCAKKRFLPVKEGQLGLRQSDALFHHTAALPEMLEELGREFDLTRISAVGVSEKPRPVEGSYMPCFLAGGQRGDRLCAGTGDPADPHDPSAGARSGGALCRKRGGTVPAEGPAFFISRAGPRICCSAIRSGTSTPLAPAQIFMPDKLWTVSA